MIFPYNVDRVTRRVPYYTYGLIGINVFIFLTTVFISNMQLPTDKVEGQRYIQEYVARSAAGGTDGGFFDEGEDGEDAAEVAPPSATQGAGSRLSGASGADTGSRELLQRSLAASRSAHKALKQGLGGGNSGMTPAVTAQAGSSPDDEAEAPEPPSPEQLERQQQQAADALLKVQQFGAMQEAFSQANNEAGYQKFWQISHAYDSVVADPHYSVLNIFAYRASNPTIVGLLGSMFLHGGFMHLIGNMIYLWVFGRALEDTLGPAIYVGAYLLCGIAATFIYHVMMTQFTPASAGLPVMGASGAIAGVLGLFALRFYRTPVRLVYVLPNVLAVVMFIALIAAAIGYFVIGIPGAIGAFVAVWAGFIIYARQWAWGTFKAASMWAIGAWLLIFNLIPGIMSLTRNEKAGGTAYWAHIGGFAFGMLYALLIGSKAEGALEYALEDAQKEYEMGNMEQAIARAENVLMREPENAGAFEVIAKAHDHRGNESAALDNYETAIQKYLQAGARSEAAALYLHSLNKNSGFILDPKIQFAVANEMVRRAEYKEAADNLAKIPFTFPEAPEGELSLLRAAQIYTEQLNELDMAVYLLNTLLERYPDTQWMVQVQRILKIADFKSRPEEPAATPAAAPPPAASNRPQAQTPPVKK